MAAAIPCPINSMRRDWSASQPSPGIQRSPQQGALLAKCKALSEGFAALCFSSPKVHVKVRDFEETWQSTAGTTAHRFYALSKAKDMFPLNEKVLTNVRSVNPRVLVELAVLSREDLAGIACCYTPSNPFLLILNPPLIQNTAGSF